MIKSYDELYYRDIYYILMCGYETLEFITGYQHYLRFHLQHLSRRKSYIDHLKERIKNGKEQYIKEIRCNILS